MTLPILKTARLTLDQFGPEHFEPLVGFFAGERSRFVGGPMTRAQVWRQLASEIGHWKLRGYGRFAVTETATGEFVGNVGPWNPEGWPEPEIGWDLMNGFEGRGFATEAALATRNWCYDELGWTTAISLIAKNNTASARLASRMGATYEREIELGGHGTLQLWRHPGPDQGETK